MIAAPSRPRLLGRTLTLRPSRRAGSLGDDELDEAVAALLQPMIESGGKGETVRPVCLTVAGAEAFAERPEPIPALVISGAGHVGKALARLARVLRFAVVVIDDRPELLAPESGLEADRVVLVGPTHAHDEAGLRQAIASRAAYVGMIGSRPNVRTILGRLLAEGVHSRVAWRRWRSGRRL